LVYLFQSKEARKMTPINQKTASAQKTAANKPLFSASHIALGIDVPPGETLRITIQSSKDSTQPVSVHIEPLEHGNPTMPQKQAAWQNGIRSLVRRGAGFLTAIPQARALMALALLLYISTRLVGITRWPIYFFTDEAVQQNFAAELVKGGGAWHDGTVLPTFFENAGQYEMNFSVYVQAIPTMLFGKSEQVARGVSAIFTLFGALALGLALQKVFRLPHAWAGVMFLSITPAWFLHSRTAFESAEAVSLYLLFLLFYWLYRSENPRNLFPCLFFGALTLYTYSPAQVVMLVTGTFLFLSDIRYHIKHWRIALGGAFFLGVLSIPYDMFLAQHPSGNQQQLAILNSYWLRDIPLWEKLSIYLGDYLRGLNPAYWFLPEQEPIVRHMMQGYGHVMWITLPLTLIGFLLALWNIRDSRFRVILIALLAAPAGAAVVGITITRALFMVVPAALFTTLGAIWLVTLTESYTPGLPAYLAVWRDGYRSLLRYLSTWRGAFRPIAAQPIVRRSVSNMLREWQERSRSAPGRFIDSGYSRTTIGIVLFAILAAANIFMTWDALANGPTWYSDYGLYGQQYGGAQLTGAMASYLNQNPDTQFIVSPDWANGTDEIMNFFLPEGFPFRMGGIDGYIQEMRPIAPNDVIILTPDELVRAAQSGLFASIQAVHTVPWPDGRTGFYFLRLRYSGQAAAILAAQKAELAKPVSEQLLLNGESVQVEHSRFDMGTLANGFDDDPVSLMRGLSANPLYVDMRFTETHAFTSIRALVGSAPTRLTVTISPDDGGAPDVFSVEVPRATENHMIVLSLPHAIASRHVRLEFLVVGEDEPTHVHVFGIFLEGIGWKSARLAPGS
jgi:hypothetical protein